jgi:hypothetical protein
MHRLFPHSFGVIHKHLEAYPQFKKIQHPFLIEMHTGGAKENDAKNLGSITKFQDTAAAGRTGFLSVFL